MSVVRASVEVSELKKLPNIVYFIEDVIQCSLVETYRSVGGNLCLHIQYLAFIVIKSVRSQASGAV